MNDYAIIIPIEQKNIKEALQNRTTYLSSQFNQKGVSFRPQKLHLTLIELRRNLSAQEINQIKQVIAQNPPPKLRLPLGRNQNFNTFIVSLIEENENRDELIQYQAKLRDKLDAFIYAGFKETVRTWGYNPHISIGKAEDMPLVYDQNEVDEILNTANQGEHVHFALNHIELNCRQYEGRVSREQPILYWGTGISKNESMVTKRSYNQLWNQQTSFFGTTSCINQEDKGKKSFCDLKHCIQAALVIVAEDYLAPKSAGFFKCAWFQRVVTGHWNRHHLQWAEETLKKYSHLQNDQDVSVEQTSEFYQYLIERRGEILSNDMGNSKNNPLNSSHLRRLNFAISKIEHNDDINQHIISKESSQLFEPTF